MSAVFTHEDERVSFNAQGREFRWSIKLKFTNKNRVMKWIEWPGRWEKYGDWRWDEKFNQVVVSCADGRQETNEEWNNLYIKVIGSELLK